jgi:quercetin dioxygenase-like cupin family protein
MAVGTEPTDGVLRRTVLKAGAVAAGALGVVAPVAGAEHEDDGDEAVDEEVGGDEVGAGDVDEPDGFEVDVIGAPAPFTDDLRATFDLTFADDDEPIVSELDDASNLIVADVTWQPGGSSGWHFHPGVALVNVVEGDLEVTWERDCVPRSYSAGESFFDPGVVHVADNLSDDVCARAYVVFLGIPEGEPATEWVEPVEC